jgi:1,4-dihydroxy-6-naphthoate synthase
MNISIGFSPCPNDTFIFDALINRKIDTEGITFIESLEDVETLNSHAIESKYDVTKLSYGVYPAVKENYVILNSGSALGTGVGPLLISNTTDQQISVEDQMIAIPGINTTAHFLFSIAYPNAVKKVFLRYDEIESFVLEGKGLGVIIHENRFTYLDKGLKKIIDLGEFWENENHVPIPLGGIVVKRNLDKKIQQKIDGLIKKSIEYAFSNYPELNDYICSHAREMSEDVMRKHIDLYVNNYSLSLGDAGRNAIRKMMEFFNKKNEMIVLSDLFVG